VACRLARSAARAFAEVAKLHTQEAHLVRLYRAGEHTVSALEELFGVTRSTVYRAIRRPEASKPAAQEVI
jgi:DNA-binding MarR family transcriptional regulator